MDSRLDASSQSLLGFDAITTWVPSAYSVLSYILLFLTTLRVTREVSWHRRSSANRRIALAHGSLVELFSIHCQELDLTLLHTARTPSSLDPDWLHEVVVLRRVGLPLLRLL